MSAVPDTSATVLVADDNDGVRQTTVLILGSAGYEVEEASDGEEALRKIAANAYDVAVLDVRMPKRDGIWVVEHLEGCSAPKVVLDSAYDVGAAERARLGTRVFRYLRKPVPPVSLLEAVQAAATAGRAERAAREAKTLERSAG